MTTVTLAGAATVFTVRDIAASLAYYRDQLGFDVAFEYGEPTFYAGLCRGDVALHLRAPVQPSWVPGHSAIAVFVDDVDAMHDEFVARGARVVGPPQDYAYGMRDFDVADLDGNRLTFGMASKSATG
jgi:uncharacterized glyoxalase superfamily protein PhnB